MNTPTPDPSADSTKKSLAGCLSSFHPAHSHAGEVTGSFSAAHSYAQGGVYVATVTVTDDDGGQDSVSFIYGVVRIDVKPAVNPGAMGVIPVQIFSDPTFAYAPQGAGVGSFGLEATVTQPRGITSNAAGDTLWVIDGTTHRVSVQSADGRLQGSLTAVRPSLRP